MWLLPQAIELVQVACVGHLFEELCYPAKIIQMELRVEPDLVCGNRGEKIRITEMVVWFTSGGCRIGPLVLVEINYLWDLLNTVVPQHAKINRQIKHVCAKQDVG